MAIAVIATNDEDAALLVDALSRTTDAVEFAPDGDRLHLRRRGPRGRGALPATALRVERDALLGEPAAQLRRICAFAGITYDQALLTPIEALRRARAPPAPSRSPASRRRASAALLAAAGSSLLDLDLPDQQARLRARAADGGGLNTHFRDIDKPMGLAVAPGRVALGTRTEVWDLRDMPEAAREDRAGAAATTPATCRATATSPATSRVHELAWAGGELWVVNTAFSCLARSTPTTASCRAGGRRSSPRWPPRTAATSTAWRSSDGRVAYVTALGGTDAAGGWRADKAAGGCCIDVASAEVVAAGLSMPHSPRWHGGRLWLLESGRGDAVLGRPRQRAPSQTVAELPGFTRGLAFVGRHRLRRPVADPRVLDVRRPAADRAPARAPVRRLGGGPAHAARSPASCASRTSSRRSSTSRCCPACASRRSPRRAATDSRSRRSCSRRLRPSNGRSGRDVSTVVQAGQGASGCSATTASALRRRRELTAGILGATALMAGPAHAALVVNLTSDGAPSTCDVTCTLRDAITDANANPGDDVITFAPAVIGTIRLTQGELPISSNQGLTITGPGRAALTVSGDKDNSGTANAGDSRIFDIALPTSTSPGAGVTISATHAHQRLRPGRGQRRRRDLRQRRRRAHAHRLRDHELDLARQRRRPREGRQRGAHDHAGPRSPATRPSTAVASRPTTRTARSSSSTAP